MSWTVVKVYSRAELEVLLREHPMRLRAARRSHPPRHGNPEFIGPIQPGLPERTGHILYDREKREFYVNL